MIVFESLKLAKASNVTYDDFSFFTKKSKINILSTRNSYVNNEIFKIIGGISRPLNGWVFIDNVNFLEGPNYKRFEFIHNNAIFFDFKFNLKITFYKFLLNLKHIYFYKINNIQKIITAFLEKYKKDLKKSVFEIDNQIILEIYCKLISEVDFKYFIINNYDYFISNEQLFDFLIDNCKKKLKNDKEVFLIGKITSYEEKTNVINFINVDLKSKYINPSDSLIIPEEISISYNKDFKKRLVFFLTTTWNTFNNLKLLFFFFFLASFALNIYLGLMSFLQASYTINIVFYVFYIFFLFLSYFLFLIYFFYKSNSFTKLVAMNFCNLSTCILEQIVILLFFLFISFIISNVIFIPIYIFFSITITKKIIIDISTIVLFLIFAVLINIVIYFNLFQKKYTEI